MLAVAAAGGAGWYFGRHHHQDPELPMVAARVQQGAVKINTRPDGNAETCETIEPLIVEGDAPTPACKPNSMSFAEPRVVWSPEVQQPPRPDGRTLRMPYADEDEIGFNLVDPLTRLLDEALPRLKIFEEPPKNPDPVEESESKEPPAPESATPPPMPDYHHSYPHCPRYDGHCPAPYPYYPRP
jgi:hypothetical protein